MSVSERRYVCTSCESIVRARWYGSGSFEVGCDCKTVPVVPQMGQAETPDSWRVERPDCCKEFEPGEMKTVYGDRRTDYRCPDCGAEYSWDGTMTSPPDVPDEPDDNQKRLVPDGGVSGKGQSDIDGLIYSQTGTIHVATDEWARVEDLSEPRITLCGTHVRNSVFESDRLSPEVYIEDLCDTCEERLLEVTDGDLSRFSYWFIEAVRRRNSAELRPGGGDE